MIQSNLLFLVLMNPRHLFFVLLATSLFCADSMAQEKWVLGTSLQMVNTKIFDINLMNTQTQGAFRPGTTLFTEYNFGKRYAIHTGLGYTMMTQNSDQFKNNFHYLSVPVYFKLGRLKPGKKVASKAMVGTHLQYLIKAAHQVQDDSHLDIRDQSKDFHMDLVMGGGVEFRLSRQISLEAIGTLALGTFINKITPAELYMNNLNMGYMINLTYKLK
jgi:hypothetical protein